MLPHDWRKMQRYHHIIETPDEADDDKISDINVYAQWDGSNDNNNLMNLNFENITTITVI